MKRMIKIISVGILGAALFSLGAFFVIDNYVDGTWPRTTGVVIGSRDVAGVKAPIMEYEAKDTTFQVISSDQPMFTDYGAGEKLRIAFNPNSPGEAKIVASGVFSIVPWLLTLTGAGLFVVSMILYRRLQAEPYDDEEPSDSDTDDMPQLTS